MLWMFQPASFVGGGESEAYGYKLTVWASPDTVDVGGETVIYAQLVESGTNAPVGGAMLNFSAPTGDGTLATSSGSTDSDGLCLMGFVAGSNSTQVNVWDNMGCVSTSCVITVAPPPPPPPSYQLSIRADQNPLQQREATTLRVQLEDTTSNTPLAGVTVYFEVVTGNATLGALSATTDGSGWCSIPVTAGTLPSQINAWDGGGYGTANGLTLMVPSIGDSFTFTLTPARNPLEPGSTTTLTAAAWDDTLDLPVAGAELSFDVQSGDGVMLDNVDGQPRTHQIVQTGGDGTCVVTFKGGGSPTSLRAGVDESTGQNMAFLETITMGVMTHTYELRFVADQSMLQPGQQSTLTAQLWDLTEDAPVGDAMLDFTVGGGGDGSLWDGTGWVQSVSAITDGNGMCPLTFSGGSLTSTVTVSNAVGSNTSQSLTFGVLSVNDTYNLSLWADDNVVLEGSYLTLHAQLWDVTSGSPVSGGALTFYVESGYGTLGVGGPDTQQTVSATTDANGNCDIIFTGGSGPSTVTAIADGTGPASYNFGVLVESYALVLSPAQTALHPGETTTVNAQLLNTTCNTLVTNAPLSFSIYPGDGSVSITEGTTDEAGNCYVTFTGGSEASVLNVSDGLGLGTSTACAFQVLGSYSLTMYPDQNLLVPGGSTTIHALLMNNSISPPSPVGNASITFTSSGNGGQGTLSDSTVTTGGNGECIVTFYGGTGDTTVWASDTSGHGTTTSCDFGVSSEPVYVLSPLSPWDPWLSAGATTTVSTTLTDAGTGVGVPDASVTFSVIDGGDGSLVDGSGYPTTTLTATTGADGVVSVNFIFGVQSTVVSAATYSACSSYTFTAPPPPDCSCQYKLAGTCTCVDFSGCTGGCQDPPACACQYATASTPTCTCANANGCAGDCQAAPPPACACQHSFGATPACTCDANSTTCNEDCQTPPPPPPTCACQYTTGSTPACGCDSNGTTCNGDCQSGGGTGGGGTGGGGTGGGGTGGGGTGGGGGDPDPAIRIEARWVEAKLQVEDACEWAWVGDDPGAGTTGHWELVNSVLTGRQSAYWKGSGNTGNDELTDTAVISQLENLDDLPWDTVDESALWAYTHTVSPVPPAPPASAQPDANGRYSAAPFVTFKEFRRVEFRIACDSPAPHELSSTFNVAGSGLVTLVIAAGATQSSGPGVILETSTQTDGDQGASPTPVDLAVDANRDGTIATGETASQAKPFRFWINNDDDPNTLGDDVEAAMKEDELSPPGFEDWRSAPTLGHIDGVRDLEDFTRLHLTLPADIIQKAKAGEAQVGFKWTNGSGPRIRVYKAQGEEGDEKYLFYKYEANLQVDSDHQSAVLDVKGSQTAFLPSSYWQGVAAGTAKLPFIFEGCEKGTAKLTTIIKFGSSAEAEAAGVWIKLMDVQEMFERGKVKEPRSEPGDVPDPWVEQAPLTFQSTEDPNNNPFQPDPDETKQYIIHVHGWRMSYNEAQTWANTSFKRLWHLGYKGRFAYFSWPTFSGATSALDGYLTYNTSEYRAWLSGAALKSYVASLPNGYTKNIMAHSMGNVVVGSAFRQGMAGVSRYALFNAAMAAQAYDPSRIDIPNLSTPDTDDDASVRSRFGLSGKFRAIPATITNFYLEDDFATTAWSLSHVVNKPNRLTDRVYNYSNSPFDIDGHGTLHKLIRHDLFSNHGVTMTEEAMAFVSRTQSLPAGRTPTNLGMPGAWQVDMDRYVFENNYRSLFGSEHSAEWIWSLQRTFGVWRELLYTFRISPNPMP